MKDAGLTNRFGGDLFREFLPEILGDRRAVGQQRYKKSTLPYLGLTTPTLRRAVRPVLAEMARGDLDSTMALITNMPNTTEAMRLEAEVPGAGRSSTT